MTFRRSPEVMQQDIPAVCWCGRRGEQNHRHHGWGLGAFAALHRWVPLQQYISHSRFLSSHTEEKEASLLFTGRSEGV